MAKIETQLTAAQVDMLLTKALEGDEKAASLLRLVLGKEEPTTTTTMTTTGEPEEDEKPKKKAKWAAHAHPGTDGLTSGEKIGAYIESDFWAPIASVGADEVLFPATRGAFSTAGKIFMGRALGVSLDNGLLS